MKYDFNAMERAAKILFERGEFESAKTIYYVMADGDPSLDAGYLGHKIGLCYERLGNILEAKYWYGRAVEENPEIEEYKTSRNRVEGTVIQSVVVGETLYKTS